MEPLGHRPPWACAHTQLLWAEIRGELRVPPTAKQETKRTQRASPLPLQQTRSVLSFFNALSFLRQLHTIQPPPPPPLDIQAEALVLAQRASRDRIQYRDSSLYGCALQTPCQTDTEGTQTHTHVLANTHSGRGDACGTGSYVM